MTKITKQNSPNEINQVFDIFYKTVNPVINFGNITNRKACECLINKFGLEETIKLAKLAVSVQGEKYAPTITTPYQLKEKFGALGVYLKKEQLKPKVYARNFDKK